MTAPRGSRGPVPPAPPSRRGPLRSSRIRAALVCGALAVLGVLALDRGRSLGWDEAMHAELPAVRTALALRAGAPGEAAAVLLGCDQYPPLWPGVLAAAQLAAGPSELVARALGRVAWAAALLGAFLAAREALRDGAAPRRGDGLAPWLALALGALSPMALAFSGTLFLEVPFLAVAALALWAWLRRRTRPGAASELLAGALVAAAFFTKFNYGLLLGAGLAADLAVDAALAARRGTLGALARRTALLALPPALALGWWFVLPLPGGPEVAARHRAAFLGFLGGNRELGRTADAYRLLVLGAFFAATPRALAVQLVGAGRALAELARPGVRTLALAAAASWIPVALHPFFLDRFLLPGGAAVWPLAGIGLARLVPARPAPRAAALAGLAVLALALPSLERGALLRATIGVPPDPAARAYQARVVADMGRLDPGRPYDTGGLPRAVHDALLDLVAAEAGPEERVGWIGVSSELSPAAIHLGLLERGGSAERFRRDAGAVRADDGQPAMCVTFLGVDPGWTRERIAAWAEAFDVVFTTRPVDLKGRPGRDFLRAYQETLAGLPGWGARRLGVVEVPRPAREPLAVEVWACRRS